MIAGVDHEIAVDLSLLNSRSKKAIFHLTEIEVITPIVLYSDKHEAAYFYLR